MPESEKRSDLGSAENERAKTDRKREFRPKGLILAERELLFQPKYHTFGTSISAKNNPYLAETDYFGRNDTETRKVSAAITGVYL